MESSADIESCYVCVNSNCRGGGSVKILMMLVEGLMGTKIQVREQVCFGACWMGPNIVLHPQGTWYCGVGADDVDDIICHIKGGAPVARLVDASDPGLHDQIIQALKSAIG